MQTKHSKLRRKQAKKEETKHGEPGQHHGMQYGNLRIQAANMHKKQRRKSKNTSLRTQPYRLHVSNFETQSMSKNPRRKEKK